MALLALYVALAIGVSFLCSILEAVLLSVTPSYVGALRDTNPAAAVRLKALKDDVDRPLAAILSLNTVAHTVGAAGAGAQAAVVFGSAAVGVFSAALTLGILVFSEIIPKTLGAVYWRGLAPLVGRALRPLILLTLPLVWLSQGITKLLARGRKEGAVSREELLAMAHLGTEEGVFEEQEARILKHLLRFNSLTVRDVMTPRTVLVAFPEAATAREVAEAGTPFSRLPVYGRSRDDVTGFVLKDDVLAEVAADRHETPLRDLRRDLLTVPPTLPLPRLFDRLLDRREHIALVVDEFGGTEGIATVEDVVETLLGLEIVDEADRTEDMQRLARRRWEERAARRGLLPTIPGADGAAADTEREAVVRYGLTGGEPPHGEKAPE